VQNDLVTSIAFFRNLNQGQRESPTTAALIDAFIRAGARDVRPVRGNGTVLFDGAAGLAHLATEWLAPWDDVVFVRDALWVAQTVVGVDDSPRAELTLFDESATVRPQRGRRCEIISSGPGFAVVLNDNDGQSDGTPTIERLLARRATSRGIPTLRKVVALV